MALTTLSVAVSVLVLKVHHTSPSYEVPGWVRRLIVGRMSSAMCMDVNNRGLRHLDTDGNASNDKIGSISSHWLCEHLESDKQVAGVYQAFNAANCLPIT